MRFLEAGALSTAAFAAAIGCAAHAEPASPVTLEGADEDIRRAIAATLPARDKPETAFDAERLAEEAATASESWMRSEGYYAGVAAPVTEYEPPRARVKLELGRRFVFAEPTVSFDGAIDPSTDEAVNKALSLVHAGAPARAAAVLSGEGAAVAALRDHGYAAAKAAPRAAIVDHATGEMSVAFEFDLGAPVRLGGFELDPPHLVKPEFVEKLPQWKRGDLYAPQKLTDLRRDLSSTSAFSRVQVTLAPETNPDGTRNVLIHLEPAKPHSIALGGSYSTIDGVGVDAQWTKRNIYGRADSLTISSNVSTDIQKAGIELFRPHAKGRGRGERYALTFDHETINPYELSAVTLSVAVEAEPRLKHATTYGASLSANDYTQSAGISNAVIATTFVDRRTDRSDDKLDPRSGTLVDARLEPSVSLGDESTVFVRGTVDARGYWSPGKTRRATLAARIAAGGVQTLVGEPDDLPLDRRFYAGGGGSVRGYEYRSIYPAAGVVTTAPPGGLGLLETSLEARFRATNTLGGALFIDGGSSFNDVSNLDPRWGAGAGLRYNLGFAPLRFDVAVPLNRRDSDPQVAFYVSLGQAF